MKTLVVLLAFVVSLASAQNVEVERVETLLLPEDARYFHPCFSPDGNRLLLTSENYGGLMLYDFSTAELTSISEAVGAGQYPVFSPDGLMLYYSSQKIREQRRLAQLMCYNIVTGKRSRVEEGSGTDQVRPSLLARWWKALFSFSAGRQEPLNLQALRVGRWDFPYAVVEKGQLMYFPDSNGLALDPIKARYYLHASLSPDGKRILAYGTGKGAFVCDLTGEDVKLAGGLEAPVWLTKNTIAGMITHDDGHTVSGSEIKIMDISSGKSRILTPEGIIAMYPRVCRQKKIIAAHTQEGKIVLIHYKLNKQP